MHTRVICRMPMTVHVEFFGIPRLRAGIAATQCQGTSLGEVLQELAERFPGLANDCFQGNRLRDAFAANLNGNRFVSDPATPLTRQDHLLIMSADAGG